jgi:hypothetical protein
MKIMSKSGFLTLDLNTIETGETEILYKGSVIGCFPCSENARKIAEYIATHAVSKRKDALKCFCERGSYSVGAC